MTAITALAGHATRAAAQTTPAQIRKGDSLLVADTIPREDHTARDAFVRALILPGWGHFGIGAYRRGAVFATLETTSWFMLTKTLVKLGRAKNNLGMFREQARDSLNLLIAGDTSIARQLADTAVYNRAVAANANVVDANSLVASRKNQRQDWITYTLFFTMASAVDAYVAANLRDFPVGLTAEPARDGKFSLGLTYTPKHK